MDGIDLLSDKLHRFTLPKGCEVSILLEDDSLDLPDEIPSFFCPDELVSDRLDTVIEVTDRYTLQPIGPGDYHLSPEQRVFEICTTCGSERAALLTCVSINAPCKRPRRRQAVCQKKEAMESFLSQC